MSDDENKKMINEVVELVTGICGVGLFIYEISEEKNPVKQVLLGISCAITAIGIILIFCDSVLTGIANGVSEIIAAFTNKRKAVKGGFALINFCTACMLYQQRSDKQYEGGSDDQYNNLLDDYEGGDGDDTKDQEQVSVACSERTVEIIQLLLCIS